MLGTHSLPTIGTRRLELGHANKNYQQKYQATIGLGPYVMAQAEDSSDPVCTHIAVILDGACAYIDMHIPTYIFSYLFVNLLACSVGDFSVADSMSGLRGGCFLHASKLSLSASARRPTGWMLCC